jgi:hypothetical protein
MNENGMNHAPEQRTQNSHGHSFCGKEADQKLKLRELETRPSGESPDFSKSFSVVASRTLCSSYIRSSTRTVTGVVRRQ